MAARLETSEAFAIDHIKRCYLNEHFLISQPIYTAQFTFFTQDFWLSFGEMRRARVAVKHYKFKESLTCLLSDLHHRQVTTQNSNR